MTKLETKIKEQIISDCMGQDPNSKTNIKVYKLRGTFYISGSITTKADIFITGIVKGVIRGMGPVVDNVKYERLSKCCGSQMLEESHQCLMCGANRNLN